VLKRETAHVAPFMGRGIHDERTEKLSAGREARTPTALRPADFKSAASASSAIPAQCDFGYLGALMYRGKPGLGLDCARRTSDEPSQRTRVLSVNCPRCLWGRRAELEHAAPGLGIARRAHGPAHGSSVCAALEAVPRWKKHHPAPHGPSPPSQPPRGCQHAPERRSGRVCDPRAGLSEGCHRTSTVRSPLVGTPTSRMFALSPAAHPICHLLRSVLAEPQPRLFVIPLPPAIRLLVHLLDLAGRVHGSLVLVRDSTSTEMSEPLPHVVLAQQRDGRPARRLAGPDGEGEHPTERGQFAVHRGGRRVVLRTAPVRVGRDTVRRDVERPIEPKCGAQRLDMGGWRPGASAGHSRGSAVRRVSACG
jgi:hypothetical protein